mmetsp:Transcript_21084/g.32669  ORF Transcript_21084/g.32669 Transcript_21084/m.32669 type:complete len:98 (+) Transcript_21084:1651-1944(+)
MASNALGNANLLVSDIGTGMKDFFYKPKEGLVNGPLECGKGIIDGTASLLGNTAKGTLGSMSRLVDSFSKGLLIFTDDEDYMNKREIDSISQPTGVL